MSKRIDWESQIGRQLRLRDLHAFFTVVRSGSMAKAAVQLGVSQPAISKVIADLEHALGVRLLDRSTRGVAPTVFGNALLKRGTTAFDELKQSVRDIEYLANPETGRVSVGCPFSIGNVLMPRMIESFMKKYPRVELHVDTVTDPQTFPGLFERKYDLYITLLPLPERRVPEGLDIEFLFSDPLVVAAPKHHRLAGRRKVEFADLVDETWIVARTDSWNYICLAEEFRKRGLPMPKVRLWSNIMPLRTQLMTNGQFLTSVSISNAHWYGMKVLPVDLPAHAWPTVIATIKNRALSPVVELFIAFVRDFTRPMREGQAARRR